MAETIDNLEVIVLRRLSALERRIAATIRIGCVAEVQSSPYRVRVNVSSADDPVVTDWLPVLVPRSGTSVHHSPLSVGEAILILSPGGESVAFALGSLPSARTAPAAGDDDSAVSYLHGDLSVVGDVLIDGTLTVTGSIRTEGSVTAGGDVRAGASGASVSLLTHLHPSGAVVTGPPQRT